MRACDYFERGFKPVANDLEGDRIGPLSGTDQLLLAYLVNAACDITRRVECSAGAAAFILKASEKTGGRALRKLEKAGAIDRRGSMITLVMPGERLKRFLAKRRAEAKAAVATPTPEPEPEPEGDKSVHCPKTDTDMSRDTSRDMSRDTSRDKSVPHTLLDVVKSKFKNKEKPTKDEMLREAGSGMEAEAKAGSASFFSPQGTGAHAPAESREATGGVECYHESSGNLPSACESKRSENKSLSPEEAGPSTQNASSRTGLEPTSTGREETPKPSDTCESTASSIPDKAPAATSPPAISATTGDGKAGFTTSPPTCTQTPSPRSLSIATSRPPTASEPSEALTKSTPSSGLSLQERLVRIRTGGITCPVYQRPTRRSRRNTGSVRFRRTSASTDDAAPDQGNTSSTQVELAEVA